MNCDEMKLLLASRWAGELDLAQRAALETHLESCAECRAEAALLGGLWERMGSLPVPEPSTALKVRWESAMESLVRLQPSPKAPRNWFAWWPQSPALQMGIAFATLLIGLGTGVLLQRFGTQSSEIAQLRDEVAGTRQMVALSLLRENTASERLKGVDYSGRMPRLEPDVVRALVQAVTLDPNVNVRLAAVDALTRASGDPQVRDTLAQSIPRQESPMVQAALIDYLVDAHDRQATPALRQLVSSPELNPLVRQRATHALQILSQ